jgi:hypothetical protein
MKRCFKESKGHANTFSETWASKKATLTKSHKCCLIRRMGMRTNNQPSGRLKIPLWWIQWSDISRCRKAIRTHFLHHEHRKKRLGWSRFRDVLCCERPWELKISLLDVLKNDFGEVVEAVFQGVERPCELIFFTVCFEKSDLDEFAWVVF